MHSQPIRYGGLGMVMPYLALYNSIENLPCWICATDIIQGGGGGGGGGGGVMAS